MLILLFYTRFNAMNPATYLPQSERLMDQVREVIRYKHYSLKTE